MWKKALEQGRRHLFNQEYQEAAESLKQAMEHCPESQRIGLSEVLFFMAAAYRGFGYDKYAYQCWENAAMLRNGDESCDFDWKAFYRIQLVKYVSAKRTKRFGSLAESDMVHDLIKIAWEQVKEFYHIWECSFPERCSLYRSIRIIFPQIEEEQSLRQKKVGQIISFSSRSTNGGKK